MRYFLIAFLLIGQILASFNPGDRFGKNLDGTDLLSSSGKDFDRTMIGYDNRVFIRAYIKTSDNSPYAILMKDGNIYI